MYKEIIDKLKDTIKREETTDFNKDEFIEINSQNSNSKIAFIDGGSAEIFSNINMSFGIIRTAYTIFQINKRIESKSFDFYFLIKTINNSTYSAELFNFNNKLEIETKFEFNNNTEISNISDNLRRLLELKTASSLSSDLIILDGNLETDSDKEKEYLEKLNVAALSKTSHILTNQGLLYSNILNNNLNYNWYYKLKDNTYFTKLNNKSKYIFKVETKNSINLNILFSLLKENSKDPIFLGYPYGLIEADRLARISNKELEYQKNLFTAKLGKLDLEKNLGSAHDILDKISF
tara:strand:- start:2757 stop:3632 length:876 start_codon:yes stop_codon:yes gene_type:complete